MPEYDELTAQLIARWPEHRIGPSLARISAVCHLLGDPQHAMPVIHIAGTNGKGTTAIIIDALLRAAGLRTGRFASPHLERVNERICIDGEPISDDDFVRIWDEIAPLVHLVDEQRIDGIRLTFFETMTAMAYAAFADAPVDVAIVEVGLGGGWDATNVADAAVAVITPVGLDHTHILGTDLAAIANEKVGIIKPGRDGRPASAAVLAGQEPAAAAVFLQRCADIGVAPVVEGIDFAVVDRRLAVGGQLLRLDTVSGPVGNLHLPLFGAHQAHNAALAVAAVETFSGGRTSAGLDPAVIQDGFDQVRAPGRLEVVRTSPTILLDSAHNPHGARAAAAAVAESFAFDPLIVVLAVMADKDARGICEQWQPLASRVVVTCVPDSARGLDTAELADIASDVFGDDIVDVVADMASAIERAVMLADTSDGASPGVVVTGSVVAVGQARTILGVVEPGTDPLLTLGSSDDDWNTDPLDGPTCS